MTRKQKRLYVVTGPSAEWADGWDYYGLYRTRYEAKDAVAWEKFYLRDAYGSRRNWPWPYNEIDFEIMPVSANDPLVYDLIARQANETDATIEEIMDDLGLL